MIMLSTLLSLKRAANDPHHTHHLATSKSFPVFPFHAQRTSYDQPSRQDVVSGVDIGLAKITFMSHIHPGWGPHNSNHVAYRNINHGHDQNVNYGQDQNISYGRDQNNYNWGGHMYGGAVNSAGRDLQIHNSYSMNASSFDRLVSITAGVGASHKAEQQFERGNCLPGTRTKSLQLIYDWRSSRHQEHPICWLSGPAGVGKSAIAMTVAQDCESEGFLASSFFFFRSDPKRNNLSTLIPTITHDLASTMPLMRNHIEQTISKDPRILEATLEVQFRALIIEPALSWSRQRSPWGFFTDLPGSPVVSNIVVIDGLDECGDEDDQLRILSIIQSAYQQAPHFPLRFLICSRPESWLQEAFVDEPLFQLSKKVVLDDSLAAHEDIRRYYRHYFHEIVTCRKYSQVQFPTPWPSEKELEILVERTCAQFIFAVTVIKFIQMAFGHPIEQLHIILEKTRPRRPGTSPYQRLDTLYDFILSVNPDYEEVCSILAAILVMPKQSMKAPAWIELVLGLPTGQVAATLRGMHSVLDIRGSDVGIRVFHTSFRDYLVDQTRSNQFHIDRDTQKDAIARQWLQNLTPSKVWQTYSSSKLHGKKTKRTTLIFTEWKKFCTSIPEPTRDLLDDLWNVDLAFSYLVVLLDNEYQQWEEAFGQLVPWVCKYHDTGTGQTTGGKQSGDCERAGQSKAHGYSSYVKRHSADEACSCGTALKGDRPALVECLVHKLQNHPRCFHLEWPLGVSPQNNVVYWLIRCTTRCPWATGLQESPPSNADNVHLTDCHCDFSGGCEPCNPGHLAYQEACMQYFQALVSLLETQANSALEGFQWTFLNIVQSLLLKHCRLDMELFSLCQMVFGLARGCLVMDIYSEYGKEGRKNILEWIETFPDTFAQEGEALKEQVLDLPWSQWAQNSESRQQT
ncbi:hypothetical protein PM082_020217 [Marasmius tenuissimus]|nr:hypothetical protein PM082_020217 [Marasmius tenuissimus]